MKLVRISRGEWSEFWSPDYEHPYNDNLAFRQWCDETEDERVNNGEVVIPDVELEAEGCTLNCDLGYLSDRFTVDTPAYCNKEADWDTLKKELEDAILAALESGKEAEVNVGGTDFRITPYTEMPKAIEATLKAFGPWETEIRRRLKGVAEGKKAVAAEPLADMGDIALYRKADAKLFKATFAIFQGTILKHDNRAEFEDFDIGEDDCQIRYRDSNGELCWLDFPFEWLYGGLDYAVAEYERLRDADEIA